MESTKGSAIKPVVESRIYMGEVLRYPSSTAATALEIDGHRNFYAATRYPLAKPLRLERGITQAKAVGASEGKRVPVIAISSSVHKVGSDQTPWQDVFDVDNGHIRYFGDNKRPGCDPASSLGNSQLLAAWAAHHGAMREERKGAIPVVFFRRQRKGFVAFEGLGLIRRCELVTQHGNDGYFANYAWDFLVLSVAPESEGFDWAWINARRDPEISLDATLKLAPEAWRTWVRDGETVIPRVRRYVAQRSLVSEKAQRPTAGSRLAGILADVREAYVGREARFEGVAAWVSERLLGSAGAYRAHGVTRATSDRGFDFVAGSTWARGSAR
ncbi:MAG: restriction endonuclease [Actinomycetota bacterium]|nr:restriction endonuclease [Actinomycetota bacterium]